MNINRLGMNRTEITTNDGTKVLFSYRTPVAAKIKNKCFITEKIWSNTTTRHINKWISGYPDPVRLPQDFFDNIAELNHIMLFW